METEIINLLSDIKKQLDLLKDEVNQNEKFLIELLTINNKETNHIYKATIKDKSTEQQAKDFLLNLAANIAGNAVSVPQIINLK